MSYNFGGGNGNGGGFLSPSQGGVEFSQNAGGNGGAGNGGAKKQRDPQSLLPVTIKQMNSAEFFDSKFRIDGREVAQISLVASILQIDVKPTNVTYLVSDGSGEMYVRLYSDSNDENSRRNEFAENSYVRVVGNLRSIGDQRQVVAFTLQPVTDFNEITFHQLDVIQCHLRNTRGAPDSSNAAGNTIGMKPQFGVPMETHSNSSGHAAQSGGSSINDQVRDVFKSNDSEQGASIEEVAKRLTQFSLTEIRKAVEFLSDEGHLYSTIDDLHYKCTVMD